MTRSPGGPTLEELQTAFSDYILKGVAGPILASVLPGGKLTARGSLEVYRNAYVARLTEALGDIFEAVWRVLGDDAFFSACRRYIDAHPSSVYNLSDYGDRFPGFLESSGDSRNFPFLRQLAEFEWGFKQLFHAPPGAPSETGAMVQPKGGQDYRLSFNDSYRLFSHRYTVYPIWECRQSEEIPQAALNWDRPERLLLYKRKSEVYAVQLQAWEHALLSALAGGGTLAQTMSEVIETYPDIDPPQVARLFEHIYQWSIVRSVQPL